MHDSRSRVLLILSWAWVVVVVAYLGWGAVTYSGLYRWLADFQLARTGRYYSGLTALVPGFVLAAPALWYIRLRTQIAQALQDPGPAAEARRIGRVARLTAVIGMAAGVIAGGAYMLSQGVPDGSEAPVLVDAAQLRQGGVPQRKVKIRGAVDPDVQTGMSETSRYVDRSSVYFAFRPEGESDKAAPVRLFVERSFGNSRDAATTQGFLPEQTGYLIENGLPPPALQDLQARGVRVASPHYVLRTRSEARREPYYITAGVAALTSFACFTVALIGGLQSWSRSRRLRSTG